MPISQAAHNALYNELRRVIGDTNADTLMSYLPTEAENPATRSDLLASETRLTGEVQLLRSEMEDFRSELRGLRDELHGGLAAMNQRIDRLFLALVGGLFLVVATFITGMFFG